MVFKLYKVHCINCPIYLNVYLSIYAGIYFLLILLIFIDSCIHSLLYLPIQLLLLLFFFFAVVFVSLCLLLIYAFFVNFSINVFPDPNQMKPNPLLKIRQVSKKFVRIKWLNLNDGEVTISHLITLPGSTSVPSTNTVKCKYMEECGNYLHSREREALFQVSEVGEIMQMVRVKRNLANIPGKSLLYNF